ncbi:MAG: hypothetical protein ACOX0T_12110 [Pelotomaculum sp.]
MLKRGIAANFIRGRTPENPAQGVSHGCKLTATAATAGVALATSCTMGEKPLLKDQ